MFSEEYKKAKKSYDNKLAKAETTGTKFTTVSGEPINPLYSPDDIAGQNFLDDINFPG